MEKIDPPEYRRLCGYAFDPSLSAQLDTAYFNHLIFKVRWKDYERPGPVGEYLEVMDIDPTSKTCYQPVDLQDINIIAKDGLPPSEINPQFHQQMVYAVAMTTIQNFEKALGRWILWSPRIYYNNGVTESEYVQRLRIYPHAFRDANAYYHPEKKAILFGYFPAIPDNLGTQLTGRIVFTCLSHDIITHELTHAIIDGINTRLIDASSPDSLAFHEAFADIVALFQHFTFPEIIKSQIAKTRGDLQSQNSLGELAQQFGKAMGNCGSLRDAIGGINPETGLWEPKIPDPLEFPRTLEPHARGAILVAAIFDSFIRIYKRKIADLYRIATQGTGILPAGEIHPDLINRFANEASITAQQILNICIRALDYCPPVDLTFGDYLRSIITADYDLFPDDEDHYRVGFIEAFRKRGIYPEGVKNLSVESLRWPKVHDECRKNKKELKLIETLTGWLKEFQGRSDYFGNRKDAYELMGQFRSFLHKKISDKFFEYPEFLKLTGIIVNPNRARQFNIDINSKMNIAKFSVRSLAFNRKVDSGGKNINHVVLSLTQTRKVIDKTSKDENAFIKFRGGCTLIFDLDSSKLLYSIKKDITDKHRLAVKVDYIKSQSETTEGSAFTNAFKMTGFYSPFVSIHNSKQ